WIEDTYGNVVTNDNSQVTIGIGSVTAAPGNATSGLINSTTSANAASGEATFTNLVLDQAGSYTLAAGDSTDQLSGFNSQSFTVTPGAVQQLFFPSAGQPTNTTAGTAINNGAGGVQVWIEDTYGNVVTGDNTSVTVKSSLLTAAPGNAAASSVNSSVNATSGEATFSNLVLTQAGSYALLASNSTDSLGPLSSQSFNITPAAVNKLAFPAAGQPTNTTAGTAINSGSGGVQVWIEDSYGNVETNDNSQVTIGIGSVTAAPGNAASGFINSTTGVNANGGKATFTNLVLDQAGSYTLAAGDSTDKLSGFNSQSFTVTPGAVQQLFFPSAGQPTNTTAGTAINSGSGGVQVWIEDSYGNVETGDNSNVSIKSNLQKAAPGNAAASSFNMNVNATSGEATFTNLVLNQAGTYTLSAGDTADSLASVNSQSFSVTAAKVSQLYFPPAGQPTNTTAGSAINNGSVQVWIEDTYGNVVTGDNTSVAVKSSLLTAAPGSAAASSVNSSVNGTSGQATFSTLVLTQAGNYALLASDSTDSLGPLSSQSFNITPATVNKLTFPAAGQPTNTTAGGAIDAGAGGVQVWIEDTYGNVVTGDNSQVTIGIGSVTAAPGSATPGFINSTTSVNASGGEATFANLVLDQAGGYTLAAGDAADKLSGFKSQAFSVTPAAASQLAYTTAPTNTTAGNAVNAPGSVQVSVEDKFGNVETGDTSAVAIAPHGPGVFTAGSTTSVNAASGAVAFSNLVLTTTGAYNLQASDTIDNIAATTSASFTVSPAAIAKLAFIALPNKAAVNTPINNPLGVQVAIEDQYGNVETGDTATVVMSIATPSGATFTTSSKTSLGATGGVTTFTNLAIGATGAYTLKANDAADHLSVVSGSLTVNTTAPVNVTANGQVTTSRSGLRYDFPTQTFQQTLTISNATSSSLAGPLQIVLTNLSPNVSLATATLNGHA
ncbi:MAG TPA: hypothetical protein VG125_04940, partial [Pirellulales bacterium]|nr:hypothetical protein [Pirellulales bacterium]